MTTAMQKATEREHVVEFLRVADLDAVEGVVFGDAPDASQGFHELAMLSLEPNGEPWAVVSPAAWGPGTTSIEPAVRAKERKLARYRASVDAAWLLLVTGAGWTQLTDSALTDGFEIDCAFDAVFLLDLRCGRLQRLKSPTPDRGNAPSAP